MTADNKALIAGTRATISVLIYDRDISVTPIRELLTKLADALEAATVDQDRADELAVTKTLLRDVTIALSAEIKAREAVEAEIDDWKQGGDAEANLGDSARAEVRRMRPVVEAAMSWFSAEWSEEQDECEVLCTACKTYREQQQGAETPHVRDEK